MRALSAGGGGGEGAAAAAAGSGSTGSSRSSSSSSSSGSLLSKLVKVRRSGIERGNGRRKGRREEGLHRNSMEGTCSEESKHVWHLYPPSLPCSLVPPLSFLDAHVRERGQSLPVLDLFLPRGLPPRLSLLCRRSSTRRCLHEGWDGLPSSPHSFPSSSLPPGLPDSTDSVARAAGWREHANVL